MNPRQDEVRPQAGDQEGVGAVRPETYREGSPEIRVDLPLGFHAPEKTGEEVFWLILPRVGAEVFSVALKHFAEEVGAGENKQVLLVVDQAGWHTGGEVEAPEGIELVDPTCARSPELQPAERLWPLWPTREWPTHSLRRLKSWRRRWSNAAGHSRSNTI